MAVSKEASVRRSSLRPWLLGLAGLVLFVLLAWTGFWFFAARQASVSLDAWIAREKAFHRNWNCPDRNIAGFPSAIAISCNRLQFDGMIFGRHYAGSLAGFVATAQFSDPSDVTVNVAAPFTAVTDDKSDEIHLDWANLAIGLGGLPQVVTRVSVAGNGLNLRGHAQALGPLAGTAKQVNAIFSQNPSREDNAIHFQLSMNGTSIPAADAMLGGSAPAEINAEGEVTQASFDPAKTLIATLDQWRASGGRLALSHLSVTRGEMSFAAHGALGLDSAHELEGRLDTKCIGFESVLRHLGVDPALITVGSLLTSLLGGGGDTSGPQPLQLPFAFSNGRLSIGPVHTSIRLPPLY